MPIPVAACTLESPVPVPLRTVLCSKCMVLKEQCRYRIALHRFKCSYRITLHTPQAKHFDISNALLTCEQVSLPPPPGGELRITNPFTTRAFLEKKIGVSSKLRLTSEIYLVRYFPSGEGRHRKQSEEINKHEHYKIHQY